MVQGAAFIILTVIAMYRQPKPPVWALTFGIILCLAAYLRRKGEDLRRIADMVLLAYSISFAIIACLLAYINAHGAAIQAVLIIVAVANIAASITSLSLMAPTAPWMTRTLTSSLDSFSREAFTASTLP